VAQEEESTALELVTHEALELVEWPVRIVGIRRRPEIRASANAGPASTHTPAESDADARFGQQPPVFVRQLPRSSDKLQHGRALQGWLRRDDAVSRRPGRLARLCQYLRRLCVWRPGNAIGGSQTDGVAPGHA